ncbi:MAG: shikimate dehydrogenase [Pseudomonadota bacterium]
MSEQTALLDRYGLIGYPVAHSKSPIIHRLFADQTDQSMTYELFAAKPDDLESTVRSFQRNGGRGLNITVPHKANVTRLVDEMSEEASIAGAVNTLVITPEKIVGHNTDGVGLIRDVQVNWKYALEGKRILILGAGGATQGVLGPLLEEQPEVLVIANRTVAKAQALADHFGMLGNVEAKRFGDIKSMPAFDLVINATSAGLKGEQAPFPPQAIEIGRTACYDMSYGLGETPFNHWARAMDAIKVRSGWGMLIEQAAESFRLWRNVDPDTAKVLKQLPTEN